MSLDWLLIAIVAFLFGYFLGKRLGREEGREEGRAVAPLLLREQSFVQGYCALCHTTRPDRQREMA